jgi:hypothetical protein
MAGKAERRPPVEATYLGVHASGALKHGGVPVGAVIDDAHLPARAKDPDGFAKCPAAFFAASDVAERQVAEHHVSDVLERAPPSAHLRARYLRNRRSDVVRANSPITLRVERWKRTRRACATSDLPARERQEPCPPPMCLGVRAARHRRLRASGGRSVISSRPTPSAMVSSPPRRAAARHNQQGSAPCRAAGSVRRVCLTRPGELPVIPAPR